MLFGLVCQNVFAADCIISDIYVFSCKTLDSNKVYIFVQFFNGVRVIRSLVLFVCFVDRCLSFSTFSFDHCVVCSSSTYGF